MAKETLYASVTDEKAPSRAIPDDQPGAAASLPDTRPDTTPQDLPRTTSPDSSREFAVTAPEKGTDKDIEVDAGHAERDFEVWWEEPEEQDPECPLNWPAWRKVGTIVLISLLGLLTPLASSMFAPGVPDVIDDFDTDSNTLATFVVSIYVLAFAFGPLLFAPLCEKIGRTWVYHISNVLFVIFTICNAVSVNMGMLIAFRFLAGFVGVAAVTIGSGTIADMVRPEQRGLALASWSMGPILGPVIGPVAGGFLIEAAGWRWVFWVIAIATGVLTIFCFVFLKETHHGIILERKAERLRKETGNPEWHVRAESKVADNAKEGIVKSFTRPLRILLFSSVCSMMCIYVAVLYGLLYILFTTFSFVFEDVYQFSTSASGLSYLGSGIGTITGLLYAMKLADRRYRQKLAAGQKPQPEDRLPLYMIIPAVLTIPAGFFIYGWGADYKVHWIVPQIGTAVTGFGVIIVLMCINTYLVDTYTINSSSAIAANTVLRSVLGGLLPLCGLDIYDSLGLGWGNTLFGFLALGLAPIPVFFAFWGERLRIKHGLLV
ncbi:Major facilitator superfamily domain, general substrate transporter [Teratosphaeria destructans]|uniref:Cercosporin MFS transporter CTB4 n=1 Tax=Teratosphaeria destructans TaxID=418781 RepID=A0A9W7SPS2_9PEZI|nr:Major facilitator superfamily domain, general substrate transporter [Teratosphaeria destructans]